MIILNFCYSINGDLAMLLRRKAILSELVITHDLRTITKNHKAKLDTNQLELLNQIGKFYWN